MDRNLHKSAEFESRIIFSVYIEKLFLSWSKKCSQHEGGWRYNPLHCTSCVRGCATVPYRMRMRNRHAADAARLIKQAEQVCISHWGYQTLVVEPYSYIDRTWEEAMGGCVEEELEDAPVHRPKDPRTKHRYNIFSRLLFWYDRLFRILVTVRTEILYLSLSLYAQLDGSIVLDWMSSQSRTKWSLCSPTWGWFWEITCTIQQVTDNNRLIII